MKKSTQNFITSLLGFIIILAGVASIFVEATHEFMTITYYIITFAFGLILIYVKNDKAVDLIKDLFKLR